MTRLASTEQRHGSLQQNCICNEFNWQRTLISWGLFMCYAVTCVSTLMLEQELLNQDFPLGNQQKTEGIQYAARPAHHAETTNTCNACTKAAAFETKHWP